MATHLQLFCGGCTTGCRRSISLHLDIFKDVHVLRQLLERAEFYLLEGRSLAAAGVDLAAYTVFCVECAEKVLPPEGVAALQARRRERLAASS